MPKLKMTWDASSPEFILWRNEMTFGGTDWQLIEEYQMFPIDWGHCDCLGTWAE